MDWESIKHIYYWVLIRGLEIKYLGGDKYKIIEYYSTGQKYWETEYKNGIQHGKSMSWHEDGQKWWESNYKNGIELK
ncbi:hypothetical protein LCGC14_2877350 [marine sediment metagenome]|uniref:Uncharacterized protein n=1 Tax=marine sediment metagenome TaxID=412755 RepID=A0A0F8Y1C0_9ZZZZ